MRCRGGNLPPVGGGNYKLQITNYKLQIKTPQSAGGQWPPLRTLSVENVGEHLVCSRGRNAECRIPVAVPGGCPRSFDLRPPPSVCGSRQKLRLTVQARFSPTATHTAPLLLPPLAAQRLVAAATRSPPCFRPRRRSGRSPNAGIVISVRSRPPLTRVSEAQSAVVNDSPVDCQSRRPESSQRFVSEAD